MRTPQLNATVCTASCGSSTGSGASQQSCCRLCLRGHPSCLTHPTLRARVCARRTWIGVDGPADSGFGSIARVAWTDWATGVTVAAPGNSTDKASGSVACVLRSSTSVCTTKTADGFAGSMREDGTARNATGPLVFVGTGTGMGAGGGCTGGSAGGWVAGGVAGAGGDPGCVVELRGAAEGCGGVPGGSWGCGGSEAPAGVVAWGGDECRGGGEGGGGGGGGLGGGADGG